MISKWKIIFKSVQLFPRGDPANLFERDKQCCDTQNEKHDTPSSKRAEEFEEWNQRVRANLELEGICRSKSSSWSKFRIRRNFKKQINELEQIWDWKEFTKANQRVRANLELEGISKSKSTS